MSHSSVSNTFFSITGFIPILPVALSLTKTNPPYIPSKQFETMPATTTGSVLLAPSPAAGEQTYDMMYYLKGAAAGGICCSITHGALTPVDVVKVGV